MSTSAILRITDGTEVVNLLAARSGFHLRDWSPALAGYKGGGIVISSPISSSKTIALRTWDFTTEAFSLVANFPYPDVAAREVRKVRKLLRKAEEYWDVNYPMSNDPVWIEARAYGETNMRYAVIFRGSLTGESNPYAQPFMQVVQGRAVHDSLILAVERTHWSDLPPGEGTALTVITDSVPGGTSNPILVGNSSVSPAEVGIYWLIRYDSFLNDLMEENLAGETAFILFINDGTDVVNDYIALGNKYKTFTLSFNINNYSGTAIGVTVELFTGTNWVSAPNPTPTSIPNGTNGLLTFTWSDHIDWVPGRPVNVDGENRSFPATMFWSRIRATSGAAGVEYVNNATLPPSTTVGTPYFTIPATSLPTGELPCPIKITSTLDTAGPDVDVSLLADRLIVASRKASRGTTYFEPFINMTNIASQNPAHITVSTPGFHTAFIASYYTPSGGAVLRFTAPTGGPPAAIPLVYMDFSAASAPEYVGVFRIFMRIDPVGASDYDWFRVRARATWAWDQTPPPASGLGSGGIDTGKWVTLSDDEEIYDLGSLRIFNPHDMTADQIAEIGQGFRIQLDIQRTGAHDPSPAVGPDFNVLDVVMIPADEAYAEVIKGIYADNITIDPVGDPRNPLKSYDYSTYVEAMQNTMTPKPFELEPGVEHRIFLFWRGPYVLGSRVQLWYRRHYYSLRGDV
jgi:hypothetical protein